jgi:2-iminobutanoate/2-iminopropanoate deaminase
MRTIITSPHAPKPVGPYSQAVQASGHFVFLSGQLGLDPSTGKIVGGGDVALEAEQVLKNVEAVLKQAGLHFSDVVKSTVFLLDMADFPVVNSVYERFFGLTNPPARSTFQVAGLPLGGRVEIECIARLVA